MTDRSDLIHQADELRRQAEHEENPDIRNRLIGMAERYMHLAESRNWSEAHPADASSLGEVFTKPN